MLYDDHEDEDISFYDLSPGDQKRVERLALKYYEVEHITDDTERLLAAKALVQEMGY